MSVLVPDLEVYEAVYEKALSYTFRNVCDINYCSTFRQFTENHIKEIVKDWLWLNEMSFIRRYEDGSKPELPEMLTFHHPKTINTYQMLKYLQCIQYNIEIETIESGKTGMEDKYKIPEGRMVSYKVLENAIREIQQVIISELPQYEKAKWSSI